VYVCSFAFCIWAVCSDAFFASIWLRLHKNLDEEQQLET
jgi:hypothetical protein